MAKLNTKRQEYQTIIWMDEKTRKSLEALADKWRTTLSAAVRRLILEEEERLCKLDSKLPQ